MRRLSMLTLAIVLALLTACPAGKARTGASGVAPGGSAATAPPAAKLIIPAGKLAWQGWQLGLSWADAQARLGDGVKLSETWATPGELGAVTASPASGEPYPEQALVFTSGQLVGYNYSADMPVEQYGNLKAELAGSLGEPAAVPPAWALGSPYFAGYKPPRPELEVWYWGDEAARAVLLLLYNKPANLGIVMLANVDQFNKANTDIAAATAQPGAAAGTPAAGAAGAGIAEVTTVVSGSPYKLDGYRLGDPYSAVQAAFPADGSVLLSKLWAVEGQTGTLGATPSDLSRQYPAREAAFLGGALAGYSRSEELSREEFIAATDLFDQDYGAAQFDPPAWLTGTPYQEYFEAPGVDKELLQWADEQTHTVLFAEYDYQQGVAVFKLVDAYAYPAAKRQTMSSLADRGEQ
jgi:hypothetical protein